MGCLKLALIILWSGLYGHPLYILLEWMKVFCAILSKTASQRCLSVFFSEQLILGIIYVQFDIIFISLEPANWLEQWRHPYAR